MTTKQINFVRALEHRVGTFDVIEKRATDKFMWPDTYVLGMDIHLGFAQTKTELAFAKSEFKAELQAFQLEGKGLADEPERVVHPPYDCYWSRRALAAEKKLEDVERWIEWKT